MFLKPSRGLPWQAEPSGAWEKQVLVQWETELYSFAAESGTQIAAGLIC